MLLNTPYSVSTFNIDLLVYANLVSTGAVDLTALRDEVFKTAREKLLTTKRNTSLSRLVSADYAINYANNIDLADDEEILDFGEESEFQGYDLEDISDKWNIPTEEELTALQEELHALLELVPDLGVNSDEIESTFNSTVKDDSYVEDDKEQSYFVEDENFDDFEDELFLGDIYDYLEVIPYEFSPDDLSLEYEIQDGYSTETYEDFNEETAYGYVEEPDELDIDYEDENFESDLYDNIEISFEDIFAEAEEVYESPDEDVKGEEYNYDGADEFEGSDNSQYYDEQVDEFFDLDIYNYLVITKPEPVKVKESIPSDNTKKPQPHNKPTSKDSTIKAEQKGNKEVKTVTESSKPKKDSSKSVDKPHTKPKDIQSVSKPPNKQVQEDSKRQKPPTKQVVSKQPVAKPVTQSKQEQVQAKPKMSQQFGTIDEEPRDLREFLRKHPNCELDTVYKYFSKKEVQKALLTGRVVKKGNKLRI